MIILLLDSYFKIKSWIYRGNLGVLVKKFIKVLFGSSQGNETEWNGMIIREWKGMYLSKGNEWNGMELSNLDWML